MLEKAAHTCSLSFWKREVLMDALGSDARQRLLGSRFQCACGAEHVVPVREAVIACGAILQIPKILSKLGIMGPVYLLADENTMHAAGENVAATLGKAGIRVEVRVLAGRPRSERSFADSVAKEMPKGMACVISCGSGTITDLGKWTAHQRGIPLVAVATAPSMNGYASGIAALIDQGLKATTPVTPAVAVIADVDVLAAAPLEMIRAGLGDLLSKPVCNADWRMATLLRGGRFCSRPFELVKDLESIYAGRSALIEQRDLETIAALTEALVFSGVSMLIAGSSEPASGGEHLISHVLDMRAYAANRLPDFHGAQVGVGTLVTARLYERLLALDEEALPLDLLQSMWERGEDVLERCRQLYGAAFPSVQEQFRKKRVSATALRAEGERIATHWNAVRQAVRPFLLSSARLQEILARAHAKTTFAQLGVDAATAEQVLLTAMCVRARYTVLDLGFAVGALESWASEITRSERVVAGG